MSERFSYNQSVGDGNRRLLSYINTTGGCDGHRASKKPRVIPNRKKSGKAYELWRQAQKRILRRELLGEHVGEWVDGVRVVVRTHDIKKRARRLAV